jgi:hypothetical protein
MGQDLRLLAGWVREGRWPLVSCPVCGSGVLQPISLEGLASTRSSRSYNHTDNPMDLSGGFHGVLKCNVEECSETVLVAGDYDVDMDVDVDGYAKERDFFRLRYTRPALRIIVPPQGTPDAVVEAIEAASAIVWADPSSAANRLRVAVEEFLTAYGMKRFVNKNGKRQRLTTHARITEFKPYEPGVGETLEAVKWIGNSGSHDSDLTVEDVLDGAEILAFALRLMYDNSDELMRRKVTVINKSQGLPNKRRRKT